jgi:hypothetical protein
MSDKEIKEEDDSLVDALLAWVLDELKASGTLFLSQLTEEQAERVRATISDLIVLGFSAIVEKDKRPDHLKEMQIVINTLNADVALATLKAQNEVRNVFQKILFKLGGGFFS